MKLIEGKVKRMICKSGSIGQIENYLPQVKIIFEKYGVVLAYLYGSQARGDAGPLSDVDIAVLFTRGTAARARFERVLGLMADLAQVFQRDDVNVLDLDEGTPLLNNNVCVYGHIIFCADEKARADFMVMQVARFATTISNHKS